MSKTKQSTLSKMKSQDLKNYTTVLLFQAHVNQLALSAFPHEVTNQAYNYSISAFEAAKTACLEKGVVMRDIEALVDDALQSGAPDLSPEYLDGEEVVDEAK